MEGRAVSADPRVGAGSYTLDSNVIAFSDQGGVVVKFKDPNPLVMKNNLMFCNIAGDYNIAAVGVCNADELEVCHYYVVIPRLNCLPFLIDSTCAA
jgi:hypothetical protein